MNDQAATGPRSAGGRRARWMLAAAWAAALLWTPVAAAPPFSSGLSESIGGCELQGSPGLDAGRYSAVDPSPRQVQFWFAVVCAGKQDWNLSLASDALHSAASSRAGTLQNSLADRRGHLLAYQALLTPASGETQARGGTVQVNLSLTFPPGQFAASSGAYGGAITLTLDY
ncbi:hypothetical protein [Deinococcus sp.]|uniref:hypothetical protein n=1 Tax=Deinococcus sp. TaxID=47478 RepID=UPI003CC540E2